MFRNAFSVFTVVIAISCNIANAQSIELTVDQSQSSVLITVLTGSDTSSITGDGVIELTPNSEPFETARITELNLSLADGFSIELLAGLIVVSVEPDGASTFLTEVGPAASVDMDNQFDQLGNIIGVAGTSQVVDDSPGDLFGGDMTIDLATVKPVPFDATDVQLTVEGEMLTVTTDVFFEFDFLDGLATMTLDGTIVLTGMLADKVLVGDVNCDGSINLLDIAPFIDLVSNGGFSVKADINGDLAVDLLDIAPFVALLSGE